MMLPLGENAMYLSRREFARLAGAAAVLPSAAFAQGAKKIRYCVVGLGRISLQHFMPGTKMGTLGEITAFVSGHRDKALKYAAEYGVAESSIYSYEDFDKIRDNPNIDAVYIALPNSMHAEYTIRAANAGKHVLCEKPMANTVKESEDMIAACKAAGKKLMIAYRCQLVPTFLHARDLVRNGSLGTIQTMESTNGFNIAPGEWRCDRKLAGGGPLMDVGIYSLNACRFFMGEEPAGINAYTSVIDHDGRFKDVEENVVWTMKFPSGALASCSSTYGASMEGFIRVHGSKGVLTLTQFGYQGIHLQARINGVNKGDPPQVIDDMEEGKDPSQFVRESDYFSKCILEGLPVGPSGEEGLKDMRAMMRIYESAARNTNLSL
jgi:predicted dehydrogenase